MPKNKITLTSSDIAEICRLYVSKELSSTHKLGKLFKLGHKKINQILQDNNIDINPRGGVVKSGDSILIEKSKSNRYVASDGKKLIAKCKITNKIFEDVNNLSGILTQHILLIYGEDTKILTNTYQRKLYENKYGKKWFEKYFDIIEIIKNPVRKCKLCEWKTKDLMNKTGCFERHLTLIHNESLETYLVKYPEDIIYHNNFTNSKLKKEILEDINKSVVCAICGEKMFVLSNTHLQQHDISGYEYKLKYGGKLMNNNLVIKTAKRLSQYNLDNNIVRKKTKPETEIINLINSWGIKCISSDRTILDGKEIDILIDSHKIGIEFNGNIHHSEFFGGKNNKYHLNKTIKANLKGYKLIQIFSDEWNTKRDLVIAKLSVLLGVFNGIKIGGRQCVIKEIYTNIKNNFLNTYHIQGSDNSNIKLGAFFNNELVGVMTFSDKKDSLFDLSRFATNYHYRIPGLGSKMLSFFIKNYKPKSIISFADRRWTLESDNNIYVKMGFNLVNILKPDYRYFHKNNHLETREHKFGFRKQILLKKFPDRINDTMTELEMIKELGYDRIWDCGLFKYELNF